MPASPVHTDPSTKPHPSSPTGDTRAPDSDDTDTSAAIWRRRFLALQESVNTNNPSKRKAENASTTSLGRGIRKLIFVCGELRDLVSESDKHSAYDADPEDMDLKREFDELNEDGVENLKRDWERSHTAVRELCHLIPNFQKKIDEAQPEELSTFYAILQHGANGACSDDLSRIRGYVAEWLNKGNPCPSPLL
ncbi:hypothetical protein CVT25_007131, partial [Psilocybe cyanescens]